MRRFARIVLATLALQPVVAWEASAKPVQWNGNGHLYDVRVDLNGLSWVQALLRADALGCGWYLATITSRAENAFVTGLVGRHPEIFDDEGGRGPWLGGFQKPGPGGPAAGWRWVTDEAFRYANWNVGEPNDAGGVEETFLQLLADGSWNDADLFGTTPGKVPRGFVVEFDKQSQAACRKLG